MKPGVPWSVKGIEPKAREAARDAARQAGLTLGQWLNQTILEQDREAPKAPASRKTSRSKPDAGAGPRADEAAGAKPVPAADPASLDTRLDEMSRKLDRLAVFRPEAIHDEPAIGSLREDRYDLADRLRRTERRTETAIVALRGDLDRIAERLDRQPAFEDNGLVALEQTLSGVVDHIELTDRRNSDVLRTIQSRLSELSTRIPASEDDDTRAAIQSLESRLSDIAARLDDRGGGSYSALETQLAELARRVESTEAFSSSPAVTALESRVNQLTDQLEFTERRAPSRSDVDSLKQRLSEMQQEMSKLHSPTRPAVLQALESRLNTLSGEINALRHDAVPKSSFDKVTQRLDEMNSRLRTNEQNTSNSARNDGQQRKAVEDRLEDLQRRLKTAEQGLGNAPSVVAVEARFQEMQERLRATEQGLDRIADTDTLEQRLAELSRRLDQSVQGGGGAPDAQIGLLDARVEELARRLEDGSGNVDAPALREIESQVERLSERLDQAEQRFSAPLQSIEASLSQLYENLETSRGETIEAAERAAIQAAQTMLADQPGVGAGDAIAALERSLAEVKTQAGNADRRTQETLEAVHDTLKRVIDRIVSLEEAPSAPFAASPDGDDRDEGEGFDDFRLPPLPDAPDFEDEAEAEPVLANEALSAPTREEDEDHAFARAYEEDRAASPRNEDFIAAARRAAQAASRESVGGSGEADEAGSEPGGLLSIGKPRKRTLLFAAAALFLAVGALSMSGLVGKRSEPKLANPVSTGALTEPSETAANGETDEPRAFVYTPEPTGHGSFGTDLTPHDEPLAVENVVPSKTPPRFAPTSPDDTAAGDFGRAESPKDEIPTVIKLAPTAWSAGPAKVAARTVDTAAGAPASSSAAAPVPAAALYDLPPEGIGSGPLRQAAASGDAAAQFEVAVRFSDGRGVSADDGKAAIWFQRAAAQGHAPAQYRLGTFYEKGRGVDEDLSLARTWYERAAESGNRKAMHNLAVLMANSSLGQPDFTRAARWFLKAAELGLADSQFNIAILHQRGLGVEADPAKAYKWFRIAGAAGDKDAAERAAELETVLEASALATVRAEVSAWRPGTPDPAANVLSASANPWSQTAEAGKATADERLMVTKIQMLLGELGYDPGPADGFMGPKTRVAIEGFQVDRGLAVAGEPTVELVRALEAASG